MALRVAFAGTPRFSVPPLAAIAAAGHELVLVLTQPDRPGGRGMVLRPSPVKEAAIARGIPVFQPVSLRAPEALAPLRAARPDVLVVVAYGLILPQTVLDLPAHGAINIHASLLPRWRGAAPIHRAILAGDTETGIAIMQMDAGLDTGPVLLEERVPIGAQETQGELHDRLADLGARLVVQALALVERGEARAQPQADVGATYAHKVGKAEAAIDWARPAAEIDRQVRAFNPSPGAVTGLADGPLKVWRAVPVPGRPGAAPGEILHADGEGIVVACGDGALRIVELQRSGGKRMGAAQFLAGSPVAAGTRLVPVAA